ncbi:MAG: transferase [Gemmatales bacterium]|nr:MAG: transferase [Gemmatales bacterium]GIW83395.1 MAG: transferase [Gemmatales bacterium]
MQTTYHIFLHPMANRWKRYAKLLAFVLATVAVLPWLTVYFLGKLVGLRRPSFVLCSHSLAIMPGFAGDWMRTAFFRWSLSRCAWTARVSFGTILTDPETTLGHHVYVGSYCVLGAIDVDDDALIASHVSVPNGGQQHGIDRLDIPIREQPGVWKRIKIGRDAWIGERAVVMADVGEQAVVGAGAVVVHPVPPRAIVAGVPARVVGQRGARQSNVEHTSPLV